jgi:predicted O-methyltransferase YrrM
MEKLYLTGSFLKYHLTAGNAHDLHSPFVFDLFNNVINDHTPYYSFALIESVRAKMLTDENTIQVTDFGTGNSSARKICAIARRSLIPKKYGQLLFRLVNYFNCKKILELGTSLGISTLYLAMPDKKNEVVTIEGSETTAAIAEKNFRKIRCHNIEIINNEFSEGLPAALKKLSAVDLVFFDGNHRKDATLKYFSQCLGFASEQSIFIFDDIHWSRDMHNAWQEIKEHPEVTLTVDLFGLGIIFFRKGMLRQHFVLRY